MIAAHEMVSAAQAEQCLVRQPFQWKLEGKVRHGKRRWCVPTLSRQRTAMKQFSGRFAPGLHAALNRSAFDARYAAISTASRRVDSSKSPRAEN